MLLLSMAACVPDGTITERLSRAPKADAGPPLTDSSIIVDAGLPDAATPVDAGSPADASTVDTGPVDSGPPDMGNLCAMEPVKPPGRVSNVYYVTPLPTHVNLTAGQVLAVGSFNGCSGTLVTDNWILSADHCRLNTRSEFCMGTQADNPNVCIRLARVVAHRSADIALAELAESASSRMPGVEPIALFADDFDASWIGTTAEAAGYGAVVIAGTGDTPGGSDDTADGTADGAAAARGAIDPTNPKVVRAAAGALFRLPVASASWSEVVDAVAGSGRPLVATVVDTDAPAYDTVDLAAAALVLGSEAHGLSSTQVAACAEAVTIPLDGPTESLNVAAAGAILCFASAQQRRVRVPAPPS